MAHRRFAFICHIVFRVVGVADFILSLILVCSSNDRTPAVEP